METANPDWSETECAAIRAQLTRILASEPFAKALRRSRFLEYVVNEMLAGRGSAIKGYAIAVEVFNKPADFDPATDPIVRVEAGRLRDRLQQYYRTQGAADPVVIELPKGAYAPEFAFRSNAPPVSPLGVQDSPARVAPSRVSDSHSISLAVLPFANLSGDPEQQYFADGLTDILITDLSKLSGLTVISRHASFAERNLRKAASEIAGDLGVRYVVEGSVIRAADRVRVSASLVDTDSDHCQWAERYDRDLTDIFAVQDDISRCIVGNLEVKLTPLEGDRLGHGGTRDLAAHDMLMRGLSVFWRYTRESCAEAVENFLRATELDPFFAAAHAWLARAYVFQYSMSWVTESDRTLGPALRHARRAVELDDLLPQAHAVLCWASLWSDDGRTAIRAGRQACALDPNDADAHLFLSQALGHCGHAEEALACVEKGMRLNPRPSAFYYYALGFVHLALEHYPQAIAALRQGIEISPMFIPNQATLAIAYAMTGDVDAGKRQLEVVTKIWPGWQARRAPQDPEFARRYYAARVLLGQDIPLRVTGGRLTGDLEGEEMGPPADDAPR